MAEDAIRAAGLVEGINYRKQVRIANGAAPDFTFLLPEGKTLHMDVKFPLDNYRRYAEAQSEAERTQFLKKFMSDVGGHIKALADRGYAETEDGVGFVLLFIPVESVWGAILQQDQPLLPHTETRRVVLCSPTTLFPILMMIRNIMDSFQMVANGREIVKAVAAFEREWEKIRGGGGQGGKTPEHPGQFVQRADLHPHQRFATRDDESVRFADRSPISAEVAPPGRPTGSTGSRRRRLERLPARSGFPGAKQSPRGRWQGDSDRPGQTSLDFSSIS